MHGVGLAGYANRSRRVAGDALLEFQVVRFSVASKSVWLVSLDALFVGADIAGQVSAHLRALEEGPVWLVGSHTHSAPALDLNKPALGAADGRFNATLSSHIIDAIEDIRARRGRSSLSVRASRVGMSGLSVHRRRPGRPRLTCRGLRLGGTTMGPDARSPVQEVAERLDFVDEAGRVICVLWHWACHPTAEPDRDVVSADYVGRVRDRIRADVGDVPVLFLQGFCGDIRPPSIRTLKSDPLLRVALGPGFRPFTDEEYAEWSGRVANAVAGDFGALEESEIPLDAAAPVWTDRHEFPSEQFVNGSLTKTVVFQVGRIGPLRLAGVSAEPSFGLAPRERDRFGYDSVDGQESDRKSDRGFTWWCGYLEDVYGYLPTPEQLQQGGYEVEGFRRSFNCQGLNPLGPPRAAHLFEYMQSRLESP